MRACRAVAREASEGWWSQGESNPRPRECHSRALPTELWPLLGTAVGGCQQGGRRSPKSGLLLLLDAFADDVTDVGVAFLFFLDEGSVVEALVDLDFFFSAGLCRRRFARGRGLLALLLGFGVQIGRAHV